MNRKITGEKLPDMQKSSSGFPQIAINKVGVRNIKVPFILDTKNPINGGKNFYTIATVSSYCDLVSGLKGINMSRISRTINEILDGKGSGFTNLNKFVKALQRAHGTNRIWIKAAFDYVYKTQTPMSEIDSYEPVKVIFESSLIDGQIKDYITIKTMEMSLCPCSKEMSLLINNLSDSEKQELNGIHNKLSPNLISKIYSAGYGAHNQKSEIDVKVEIKRDENEYVWIEDIVDIIRESSSCPTWSTLKREDEKYVTEASYMGSYIDDEKKLITVENSGPKFVEDISRNIAERLNKKLDKQINDYCIVVNNHESIHSENITATSVLTANRELK